MLQRGSIRRMRTLYHSWLDVPSRKVRLHLAEKGLEVTLQFEKTWERRAEFFKLNPAGEVPVLEDGPMVVPGGGVIAEYIEETYPQQSLLPADPHERLEVRRMCTWMDVKFYQEVTRYLVEERVTKRFLKMGHPNGDAIRAGRGNLRPHLDYLGYLLEQRHWLAGERLTLADVSAAAQLSSLDYLDEMDWALNPTVKEWYQRFKSRPSMRDILADRVPGMPPPKHYSDLDF